MASSRRHSHRHHSALSAVPSLSLSVSTSRASSVFSTTTESPNYCSSSSPSSPTRPQTHLRHHSIEMPLSSERLNSSIALEHQLTCSTFLVLANGGRMTFPLPPAPPPPQQRWDDSQLALDLADDIPVSSISSSSAKINNTPFSRRNIKTKVQQWISPLKKKQSLTQWLSNKLA
ncbi:hypothetical protein BCR42DRAFT_428152 [Absidia repens]|uniref:Uncharacterized protein n=1 Tax=Absidia repens TaxID=90262 RepID=A0A1X2HYG0_9FUNG|nr:hypothetical protein BCR42DRAFT_428152 [Absidia repens]